MVIPGDVKVKGGPRIGMPMSISIEVSILARRVKEVGRIEECRCSVEW